jgi:hypothetical protein
MIQVFHQEYGMFPDIHSYAQWREVRHKIDLVRVNREPFGEPEEQHGDEFIGAARSMAAWVFG